MSGKNIKKGQRIVTITIGIISFVLAFIIFMQFKFVQNTDIASIKNMREDELREELVLWKGKNQEIEVQLEEVNKRIVEYENSIESNEETARLIDDELRENKLLLGETDVYGEGVVIYYESGEKNVTDSDLRNLVSELYQADAEAISINGQRIVNSTEIVSNDTYIIINGEPIKDNYYVIKVIGNKKLLEANLTGKNGIVEMAPEYGKKVSVESKNNVKISKHDKEQKADSINLK